MRNLIKKNCKLPPHAIFLSQSLFHYHPRKIFPYARYITPARGDSDILQKKEISLLKSIHAYKDNIIYHAEFRALLYYLLMIVYYNTKRIILSDRTQLQHGSGRGPVHACHSSLFPGICDSGKSIKKLPVVRSSMIDNTVMEHWNNMTVLCPAIVNQVDTFFEGNQTHSIYRKRALILLNLVSQGTITPEKGFQIFIKILEIAFSEKKHYINQQHSANEKVVNKVFHLQKKGTRLASQCTPNFLYQAATDPRLRQSVKKTLLMRFGENHKKEYALLKMLNQDIVVRS